MTPPLDFADHRPTSHPPRHDRAAHAQTERRDAVRMATRVLATCVATVLAASGCGADSRSPIAAHAVSGGQDAPDRASRVQIGGHSATVWASSELASDDGRYAAARAVDGDVATAWVEGAAGVGEGERLWVRFDEPVLIEGFAFVPGYAKTDRLFARNGVPLKIGAEIDGVAVGAFDVPYAKTLVLDGARYGDDDVSTVPDDRPDGCYHTSAVSGAIRVVRMTTPRRGRLFSLEIRHAERGERHADTALSEIDVFIQDKISAFVPDDIWQTLVALTSNDAARQRLIARAEIVDLRPVYVAQDGAAESRPSQTADTVLANTTDPRVWWARVPQARRAPGRGLGPEYLDYTRASLVDALVTVLPAREGYKLAGAVSFARGTSEWIERRPVVRVEGGRIARLGEAFYADSAPGCRDVLPTAESR